MARLQIIPFLALFSALLLNATEVPNGKTALFEFPSAKQGRFITYDGKRIPLLTHPRDPKRQIALVPVPYRSEPGDKNVLLCCDDRQEALPFCVVNGDYAFETLQVDPSKVTPNPKQKKRIAREYREAMEIYAIFTPERYWNTPFALPMQTAITSRYGTARLFNGSLKSFHSGTDFRAKTGTPIEAVNDGVVVLAKERYYAGNSVVIDHGEGLYSCYYHLSRIDVTPGQHITKNTCLGLSGKSGRVTGPHLHFAFMLHGVQVDPLQLIETVNTLF